MLRSGGKGNDQPQNPSKNMGGLGGETSDPSPNPSSTNPPGPQSSAKPEHESGAPVQTGEAVAHAVEQSSGGAAPPAPLVPTTEQLNAPNQGNEVPAPSEVADGGEEGKAQVPSPAPATPSSPAGLRSLTTPSPPAGLRSLHSHERELMCTSTNNVIGKVLY